MKLFDRYIKVFGPPMKILNIINEKLAEISNKRQECKEFTGVPISVSESTRYAFPAYEPKDEIDLRYMMVSSFVIPISEM